MNKGWFITGTDTGVGKTYFTTSLLKHLRAIGIDAVGFKPICCGTRDDSEAICAASGGRATIDEVNPVWLRPPAAPYSASIIEERLIDLALIRDAYAILRERHACVIAEGAGGWLVPIHRDFSVADLATEFALPVVVVVQNRLGCLNHSLLTTESVRTRGLTCAGFVLNHGMNEPTRDPLAAALQAVATRTNRAVLEDVSGLPILCELDADGDVPPEVTELFTGTNTGKS
jgi:dethiobiotin synthetase